jgi:hypothetical protein
MTQKTSLRPGKYIFSFSGEARLGDMPRDARAR